MTKTDALGRKVFVYLRVRLYWIERYDRSSQCPSSWVKLTTTAILCRYAIIHEQNMVQRSFKMLLYVWIIHYSPHKSTLVI